MEIAVTGMDPSFLNWGSAELMLNIETGDPTVPHVSLIQPVKWEGKQTRVSSEDLYRAEQLAVGAIEIGKRARVVFIEMPVGSQSAAGMKAYGICIGIVAVMRSLGIHVIEVSAMDSKLALTGNKNASKRQMIDAAQAAYPTANWPKMSKNKQGVVQLPDKCEHMADAIGAIHAGVRTQDFKTLLKLLGVQSPK